MFDSEAQRAALGPEDQATLQLAIDLGQVHLFAHWPEAGSSQGDKLRQLTQLRTLDAQYPGGLRAYVDNARALLAASRRGDNPYAGCIPEVPEGERLTLGDDAFEQAESAGLAAAGRCGFVLVAGGLGERLGYDGIKIALPAETATGRSFIGRYAQHLLALQQASNALSGESRCIPLAIMTSDDTDAPTRALLRDHDHFGLSPDQVSIIKQELVPSLIDDRAHFAQAQDDPFRIETKPHGHGDVHVLMHGGGLARRWLEDGVRYVAFFQDTNGLVFHAMAAALGVSEQHGYAVNSIVVPRRAGEAAGGIVALRSKERTLTINVEYNQLDPLLRATVSPEGDVADDSGYSPYPGNINVLIIGLSDYVSTLDASGGGIPEFVNPKYADAARTHFKSPTRLECMMQDYPKLLAPDATIGFSRFERWLCFSAVKNALSDAAAKFDKGLPPEGAGSGEADLYELHRRYLTTAGAEIEAGAPSVFGGLELSLFPIVCLCPAMCTSVRDLRTRVGKVRITARSSLVIEGDDVTLEDLTLDGALTIRAVPGARVTIAGLKVHNDGWGAVATAGRDVPEAIAMRGFELERRATRELVFDQPGDYLVGAES